MGCLLVDCFHFSQIISLVWVSAHLKWSVSPRCSDPLVSSKICHPLYSNGFRILQQQQRLEHLLSHNMALQNIHSTTFLNIACTLCFPPLAANKAQESSQLALESLLHRFDGMCCIAFRPQRNKKVTWVLILMTKALTSLSHQCKLQLSPCSGSKSLFRVDEASCSTICDCLKTLQGTFLCQSGSLDRRPPADYPCPIFKSLIAFLINRELITQLYF